MSHNWWNDVLKSDAKIAQSIIKTLQKDLGVKLLAFDFDLTLINLNTGGKWKDSVDKLASHVRPCFKELIIAALSNGSLKICIVTFSIQSELIDKVLKHIFPYHSTDQIIIEANPTKIKPQLSFEIYKVGKQNHLNKVTQKLQMEYGMTIQPHEIFLFDDRRLYVKIARKIGQYAYLVNNNISLQTIHDYLEHLISKKYSQGKSLRNLSDVIITSSNVDAPQYLKSNFSLPGIAAWNNDLEAKYGIKMTTSLVSIK